ncbi:MAG: DUF1028 domain-containing protein [Candidatus Neomarinimicrobiota bacterium]
MKNASLVINVLILAALAAAQTRPVSTYSIVALDEETGQFGVAVQSHWFSVGSVVPWAEAGVGAVATQSFVRVEYGPEGLALMKSGKSAPEALQQLLAADEGSAVRQVAMIDINGKVAAHTGAKCIWAAGNQVGKNYSVQANLMENPTVWPAMAQAYENATGDLADRMLAALEAAQSEGGDIRGKQSAAMLIVSGKPTGIPWKDVVLNLRIEDHPDPLVELKRLIRIHRAYQHANQGDLYLETSETEKALAEYDRAAALYPENPELPYWSAVTLADIGRVRESLPLFKAAFAADKRWRTLTPRLVKSGLLPDDKKLLELILSQ